jgi:tRNA pseudouridine38-40 synthase
MRYFIKLAYDGTNFHGWQVQENAHTVQAELEQKLSLLLGRKIEVTGCGRTDTGVHAKEFYAHFDINNLPFRP